MALIEKILNLWEAQDEWNALLEPGMNWWGNTTYNRLTKIEDLQRAVDIQKWEKQLKKEIRKDVGIWRYLEFLFNEVKFVQKLTTQPNK